MNTRRARLWLTPVLVAACLLAVPAQLPAQCVTAGTNISTLAGYVFVTKTLTASAACNSTAMNAFFCFPGAAPFMTNMLYATARTATVAPYCNWSCNCGIGPPPHVVIDGSDGLPVELMEFSVEDEVAEGGPDDDAGGIEEAAAD